MSGGGFVFFVLFGVVLLGMYIIVRRRLLSLAIAGFFGISASILLMTISALAQGNTVYQALFVGILVGGLFSVSALVIANFFTKASERSAKF